VPTTCWTSVRGRRLRATRLDSCCAPLPAATPCASLTSSGFVSVAYSPEIAENEDIELRNAGDEICVTDPGCSTLKYMNVEITLCQVDPDLFTFMTGSPLVLDFAGNSVGNRVQTGSFCSINFALEVWTDIPSEACTVGGTDNKPYGYFLLPCVGNGVIGDFTIENDALTMTINARARSKSGWGVGPYDVDAADLANTPGPLLTPIGPDDLMDIHLTTIAPPPAVCGCVPMPA
jgi:hypothetical protein